jgi:sigma-B regulation protein RsbU (phosphoserine phosphatase)
VFLRFSTQDFRYPIKDVHGIALAVSKRTKYKTGSFTLTAGDTLFVFTDGVTEANNAKGELMGSELLLKALNQEPDADPQTLIGNVHRGIADFVKRAPQFDDTTMLCIKYYGMP